MQKVLIFKCGIIVLIALILIIPLTMISNKIDERRSFQWQARQQIAQSWTGEQTVLSPLLVIPYQTVHIRSAGKDENGEALEKKTFVWHKHYVAPDQTNVKATVDTELRKQGIYGVPVYSSVIEFSGLINSESLRQTIEIIQGINGFQQLGEAYLALHLADIRGIDNTPVLNWLGQNISFESNSGLVSLESGIHAVLPAFQFEQDSSFQLNLSMRGMDSFKLVPASKQFQLQLSSTWPHPQFTGAFLPQTRSISEQGFEANWELNHFSTGIEQLISRCENQDCLGLFDIAFGVNFIESVDSYLQSERSLKYGILFIGLSFIAFFIFETLRSIPIHPVQYTLVGFAIAVFFLLLTSLSEHLSFGLAYLLATMACISLLTYYLRFVLKAWKQAFIFAVGLSGLYALLFVIVGAEDFALLMGSVLIFLVLAGIMIITRHINWYQLNKT